MISNYPFRYPIPIVGRIRELEDITTRLQNPACQLLTLTGLGGSGKTRLAVEAARRVEDVFPDGAVFVGLQPLTRSNSLVPAIGQAAGLTFFGQNEIEDQLFEYLREKRLLLILDNFEHLLDAAVVVSKILSKAPQVKVLATSREALSLREEWLYPLKGLPAPPSIYSYTSSLEEYDAAQLFVCLARRVQPDFAPAREHEAIVRICNMTGGLPLALELAASWLKVSSATQIARNMQTSLSVLATRLRDVEERHRSMRAVFDQTWALLPAHERLIFARLSVFRGGFDGEAAAQVAGASFADLAALVEKSLVQLDSSDRFAVHQLLQQYGTEKLAEYGESAATCERATQHFARQMLAFETGLKQPNQLATLRAIEKDFENIQMAWDWSVKHQQFANLHLLLNGLYLYGYIRGRYREMIAIFEEAIEQGIGERLLLGRLLTRRWGYLQWWYLTDYQEALAGIEMALEIATTENNLFEVAFAHLMAAYARINKQQYREALPHLETSRQLFNQIEEPYYVCWVLHRLGYVHFNLNRPDRATAYTEQSLGLAEQYSHKTAMANCLYNLGAISILSGDYLKAECYNTRALEVATELGHQAQISYALSILGLGAFCRGDYSLCEKYVLQAYKIMVEINLIDFHHYDLALLILLACLREDYAEGVRLKELGQRQSSNIMGRQLFYWALATLACGLDKPAQARLYLEEELQLWGAAGQVSAATVWVVPSAVYVLQATMPQTAVELLAWVLHYPDTALAWARRWPLLGRVQARLKPQMAEQTYQNLWERGKKLTLNEVNALIRQQFQPEARGVVVTAPSLLLTTREGEILGLLAEGMTNTAIAAQLVIGAGTVKTHTLSIYRKLEVANRTQAILKAQELGILQPLPAKSTA